MTPPRRVWLFVVVSCFFAFLGTATAQQFEPGDVIVSGVVPAGGLQEFTSKLLWYGRSGQLKRVLATDGTLVAFEGVAFSPSGVLHAGHTRGITTVSPAGAITRGVYGSQLFFTLSFGANGSLIAGDFDAVTRFSASGALLNRYQLPILPTQGLVSIDLGSDQCTLFYTTSTSTIRRFDVCTGSPLVDIANIAPSGDFRVLPDGGFLVSHVGGINVYSSGGVLLRQLAVPGGKLALDVTPGVAWSAQPGGLLTKFDFQTGQILFGPFQTGLSAIAGITVYGEPRAALINGPLAAIPALSTWMLMLLAPVLIAIAFLRLRSE